MKSHPAVAFIPSLSKVFIRASLLNQTDICLQHHSRKILGELRTKKCQCAYESPSCSLERPCLNRTYCNQIVRVNKPLAKKACTLTKWLLVKGFHCLAFNLKNTYPPSLVICKVPVVLSLRIATCSWNWRNGVKYPSSSLTEKHLNMIVFSVITIQISLQMLL